MENKNIDKIESVIFIISIVSLIFGLIFMILGLEIIVFLLIVLVMMILLYYCEEIKYKRNKRQSTIMRDYFIKTVEKPIMQFLKQMKEENADFEKNL